MKKRVSLFSKLIIATSFIFPIVGCNSNSGIMSIVFDNNYQSVWKVGEIDFSALKFFVTLDDGTTETVPVTIDMIDEADLYKFYEVGDWKIKINYNNKISTTVEFIITENSFDKSIKLKNETIAYDGKSHSLSLEGPLPEGTKVYYPNGNSFTSSNVNPYKVTCIISKEGYKTKELTGYLTITKSEYSKELLDKIDFSEAEYTYDGIEKRIEAKNIPADCTVDYFITEIGGNGVVSHGNSAVNAGSYSITGVIKCSNPNYYEIPNIETTLTINKAVHKLDDISFDDSVFGYEAGVERMATLTNEKKLPNNVKVRYENNIHEDVGEYKATAYFEVDSNYAPIEPMSAKMTITPKEVDLASVKVQKMQTMKFDGEAKDFAVEVPGSIKVIKKYYVDSREVDEPIDVGTYEVKLSYQVVDGLDPQNYSLLNLPADSGLLIIEKKVLDLSKLNFENQSICYDGNSHGFEFSTEETGGEGTIVNDLPEELEVGLKYFKNGVELTELPKEIGDYVVSFDIAFKDEINGRAVNPNNYSIINEPTKTGMLQIVKNKIDLSNVKIGDQNRYYNDGKVIKYELSDVPDSVIPTIKYYSNGMVVSEVTDVGTYDVSVTFALDQSKGYSPDIYEIVGAPTNLPSLIVQKKVINMADVVPRDIKVSFTGESIAYKSENISNYSSVSKYVHSVCEYYTEGGVPLEQGTYPKNEGVYRVIISFAFNGDSTEMAKSYSMINAVKYSVKMEIV